MWTKKNLTHITKNEAKCPSETSVNFYQIKQCHIPEQNYVDQKKFDTYIAKNEAKGPSETTVNLHQIKQCHIPEENYVDQKNVSVSKFLCYSHRAYSYN
jgi:hypothetical protein